MSVLEARRPRSPAPGAHLLLGDLHVQQDVVDELRQGFSDRAFELAVLQQRVDKLENAEDEVFKAQDFACRKCRDN